MSITVDYISDWTARLKTRLYTQFRDADTWNAICELLGQQFQDLEDAFQTLLNLPSIDDCDGINLDRIGKLVGQPRLGVNDPDYRRYLRGRVGANRSAGTPEDLYAMYRAMFTHSTLSLLVQTAELAVKSFFVRIGGAITATDGVIALSFLRDAKEAGARAVLEFQQAEDDLLFSWDDDPTGLGYGDVSDSTVGGVYADALQAHHVG